MEKALQVKLNYKLKNYVEKNVWEKWIGYFYFCVLGSYSEVQVAPQAKGKASNGEFGGSPLQINYT